VGPAVQPGPLVIHWRETTRGEALVFFMPETEEAAAGRSPAMESPAAATTGPCKQGRQACSTQSEADHNVLATVASGLSAGDLMAANYGGGAGEARSSGGAAWYDKRAGVVGLGG
jgi:hypothetical protein